MATRGSESSSGPGADLRPLPLAEVIARFDVWVNETAAHQAQEQGPGLVCHKFGAPPGHSSAGSPWLPSAPLTWGLACLFFGDPAQGEVRRAGPHGRVQGRPAGRRARGRGRGASRAGLAALEAQEDQLIDEAVAAGVTIEHRDEVKQRSEQEQRRRESAERAKEQQGRRQREAAVDTPHERGVTRSPYLQAQRPLSRDRRAVNGSPVNCPTRLSSSGRPGARKARECVGRVSGRCAGLRHHSLPPPVVLAGAAVTSCGACRSRLQASGRCAGQVIARRRTR